MVVYANRYSGKLTQRTLVNSRHEHASASVGEEAGWISGLGHGLVAVMVDLGHRDVIALVDLGSDGRLARDIVCQRQLRTLTHSPVLSQEPSVV